LSRPNWSKSPTCFAMHRFDSLFFSVFAKLVNHCVELLCVQVRASVASIVRSPFTRDGSDNSSSRKSRQPVSFALSSGPAPSLCLSANSFDAMATVLLSLLSTNFECLRPDVSI
jgi:hypothetical protein